MTHAVITVRKPGLNPSFNPPLRYGFVDTDYDPELVKYLRHLVKRVNRNATVRVQEMPDISEIIESLERAELFENRHVLDVIARCAD